MDKQGLVLNGIGKQFYGITVLSDIDFEILPGEIHGLLGENGAGKSTLMKIINGALTPTTGDIYIDGEKMSFDSPHAAANHGIRMVYQELDLFPHLTVAENICQGNIPKNKAGMVDWKEMERVSKEKVTNLSGGNQQKVVIAKWFASKARIIVLDEPTRGIDIGAKVEVYKLINEMVEAGIGVILLSSEVPEVFGMADRILVLKDGQITGEYGMDEINKINETDLQRLVM